MYVFTQPFTELGVGSSWVPVSEINYIKQNILIAHEEIFVLDAYLMRTQGK